MAYESHASGSNTANGTTTSSGALAVTAGRTIVVVWSTQEDGGQTHTIADTAGNTYTAVVDAGSAGERVRIWVAHTVTGHASNVVTVTSSGAHRYKFVDQIQLNTGGTGTTDDSDEAEGFSATTVTTPSMTASGAGTIVYGTSSTNDRTWTPGASFTELTDMAAGLSTGYRDLASAGSFTASATASGATNGCIAAIVVANAAGGPTISGTADQTLGALASTATGTLALAGAASITLGALTATATGTLALTGQATVTLGALTAPATGAVALSGAADSTLGALTSTATGTLAITGAASATLGALIGSADGILGSPPIEGAGVVTFGALTSTGTGTLALTGTATVTLGALTAAAVGVLEIRGHASVTLGALAGVAVGGSGTAIDLLRLSVAALAPVRRVTYLESVTSVTDLVSDRTVTSLIPARHVDFLESL